MESGQEDGTHDPKALNFLFTIAVYILKAFIILRILLNITSTLEDFLLPQEESLTAYSPF